MDHFGDTKHSEDARRFNTREKAQQSIGSWLGGSSEAHGNPHSGQSFTESGFWHAHTQNPEDDLRRRDHLPIVARPISGDTATEARRDLEERLLKAREDAKAIPKYMEIISQLKKDIESKKREIPIDKHMDMLDRLANAEQTLYIMGSNRDIHYNNLVDRDDAFKGRIHGLEDDNATLQERVENLEKQLEEAKQRANEAASGKKNHIEKKNKIARIFKGLGFGRD